jgi:hypothetical protein
MNYNVKVIEEYLQQDIIPVIEKSKCTKWHKWFNDGEVPYPCVCIIRKEECIELELYYELQKVINIYNQKAYFKQALDDYSMCGNEQDKLISWAKNYEALGSKLFFSQTITILSDPAKNNKLTIQLNPDEFSTVIQFQEIFNTVYYSEEFQTNINLIKI